MALIHVSDDLLKDEEMFEAFFNAFDKVEQVERKYGGVTVFRVQREEVTTEDKIICPNFYQFEGVLPFIIEFDCS